MRWYIAKQLIDYVQLVPLRVQRQQFQPILLFHLDFLLLLLFFFLSDLLFCNLLVDPGHNPLKSFHGQVLVLAEFDEDGLFKDGVDNLDIIGVEIIEQEFLALGVIVLLSQIYQNLGNAVVFFFHLLVMAPALFSFPSSHKGGHGLEDLVHPAHVLVQEMMIVNLKEPVISLVLLQSPMTKFLVRVAHLLSLGFP